jgi:hypothetical protein
MKSNCTADEYRANSQGDEIEVRLAVLRLATELDNVAEACRRVEYRPLYFLLYAWKRRYDAQGTEGLKRCPPASKSHPQTTPQATVEMILSLSQKHPEWGCGPPHGGEESFSPQRGFRSPSKGTLGLFPQGLFPEDFLDFQMCSPVDSCLRPADWKSVPIDRGAEARGILSRGDVGTRYRIISGNV